MYITQRLLPPKHTPSLQVHSMRNAQQFLTQVAQLPSLQVLLYHNGNRGSATVHLPTPLIQRATLQCLDLHFDTHELDLSSTDLTPLAGSLTELRMTNATVRMWSFGGV